MCGFSIYMRHELGVASGVGPRSVKITTSFVPRLIRENGWFARQERHFNFFLGGANFFYYFSMAPDY